MDKYSFSNSTNKKFYNFPYEIVMKICSYSKNIYPYFLYMNKYQKGDIFKLIKLDMFKDINDPYDLLEIYIEDILFFEKVNAFMKSRYFAIEFLKNKEYDNYINFLFYIKLYTYYLKIKIRNILMKEYIIQYNIKYQDIKFTKRIPSKCDILQLLENEKNIPSLEHYLYELIISNYTSSNNLLFEDNDPNKAHHNALAFFFEKTNIHWIRTYWKYIERTDIYKKMMEDDFVEGVSTVFIKYKSEFEPLFSQAYFIEDISYDNEFIFNRVKKLKKTNIYCHGYTNYILKEVDFIIRNLNNIDHIKEKYDLDNLFNICYYKSTLNIEYYTINIFKPVTGNKLQKKLISIKDNNSNSEIKCPFRNKDCFYKSKKYEVPFTKINQLYSENPDKFIIYYFDYLKDKIQSKCLTLKFQSSTLENHKRIRLSPLKKSERNKKYLKTKKLNLKLKNKRENRRKLSENTKEYYKQIFEKDEFLNYFIEKFTGFISSSKIYEFIVNCQHRIEIINAVLNKIENSHPKLVRKKIYQVFQEKTEIENLLKVCIFFFFNLRDKNNLVYLNDFLIFVKSQYQYFYKNFPSDYFINILNCYRFSSFISKVLYIDNLNAHNLYADIIAICHNNKFCFRKCNNIPINNGAKKLEPKEILQKNMYYFYFDLNTILKLGEQCEQRNKDFEDPYRIGDFYNKNINFKPLIHNIFRNNINLFFSYIYNAFNDVFESDYLYFFDTQINKMNKMFTENLQYILSPDHGTTSRDEDPDNEFNIEPFEDMNLIEEEDDDDNEDDEDDEDIDIKNLLEENDSKADEIYNEIIELKTNKTYNSTEIFKLFKNFFELKNKVYLEFSPDDSNDKKIIKIFNNFNNYKVSGFYNKTFNRLPELSKAFENFQKDHRNDENEIQNNLESLIFKVFEYLDDYHKLQNITIIPIYGQYVSDCIKHFVDNKVNKEFFISLCNDTFIDKFRDDIKYITESNNNSLDSYKKHVNQSSMFNSFPKLLVDYEYFEDQMIFLDSIIKFYDEGLLYNYEEIMIEGEAFNNYNDLQNIKFIKDGQFYFEDFKTFYPLTMAIYLLNSTYETDYIHNSIDNLSYCCFNNMNKNALSRWLNWNPRIIFEMNEEYNENNQSDKKLKMKIFDDCFKLTLKDYCSYDNYTNINTRMLSSYLYYISGSNLIGSSMKNVAEANNTNN